MFAGHYIDWRSSRMNGVKKYISPEYFKSKTLLELGCGHADIGNMFYELGAIVTSSDARKEHLETVKQKYPHIKTLLIDGDNDSIKEKYDVIVHWGLLYHLSEIEMHLEKVSQKCDILLLETEVSDSNNKEFYIKLIMEAIMNQIVKKIEAKFYNFLYFIFWGFYFSAGYLFYKKRIIPS